jgi:hypothetical protein
MDLGVLLFALCDRLAEGRKGRVSDNRTSRSHRLSRAKGEVADEYFENSNNHRV